MIYKHYLQNIQPTIYVVKDSSQDYDADSSLGIESGTYHAEGLEGCLNLLATCHSIRQEAAPLLDNIIAHRRLGFRMAAMKAHVPLALSSWLGGKDGLWHKVQTIVLPQRNVYQSKIFALAEKAGKDVEVAIYHHDYWHHYPISGKGCHTPSDTEAESP